MKTLPIFRKLHHVCIVVRDIEKATEYYESIGVGPWNDFPPLDAFELQGYNREAFLQMRYRFANIDNVQLQLCQPGQGDTPQRRFLDARGEGVFHLGFDVEDVDQSEADAGVAGLSVLGSGRLTDRSGFTYFDTAEQGAGVTLEIRRAGSSAKEGLKA
ncbi:VOC family protein [Paraburkholderia tropica]|uniref:VOC family protein n=1 Tax=Paraburkholderia tropica TaxID=92647 RepID=UPI002ABE6481|nr:VOC family protein [Paraburkholderia tropica]